MRLSCKDLMIGDWVNVVVKWKPEIEYMQGEVSELLAEDGWLRVLQTYDPYEDNPVYCICDTQGIPLTPEILEKNGWSKENEGRLYVDSNNVMIAHVEKHFELTKSWQRHYNRLETIAINIRYLHELQHVLRLCGIEKEIVC